MTESDCEIEYLDEDADIVQQCFQTPQIQAPAFTAATNKKITPLLIERQDRKKKKRDDDDSDYDPSEDFIPPSPPSPKIKRRKPNPPKRYKADRFHTPETSIPNLKSIKKIIKQNQPLSTKEQFGIRKKLNIRIPDYSDPLCLPVKAMKNDNNDLKRLNVWNNVCLEHFKHCDTMLRPERGETKSSIRSVVLRNVANKQTGKVETTIWSKTSVENEDGDKKSEIFQCVLPRYKERLTLNSYPMIVRKPKPFRIVDEVLLAKEVNKDGESLVVYKPNDAVSSVYMLFDKRKGSDQDDPLNDKDDDDSKIYMKEVACCKVCSHCYQMSWRGAKKTDKKSIVCPVCARTYVTVYNLLSHLKSHTSTEMQRYKRVISAALAEIVEYHYKCRICLEKFECIKKLRQHVKTHQSNEIFMCEVGNHMAK